MLCVRFYLIKEILAEDGCFWVHLDWHVAHYAKILLDEVFGYENFVNEIIWNYKSGGSTNRRFARKHDTLLFYSKNADYYFKPQKEKSYNRGLKPYRFKGVLEEQDEIGWYTMVNMKDVWQIDMVGRTSGERTGYATQKPEALLERIIESCSRPGDLVADFFGGSGTLAVTAAKLGRGFISCDMGELAIAGTEKRMQKEGIAYKLYASENEKKSNIDVSFQVDIAESENLKNPSEDRAIDKAKAEKKELLKHQVKVTLENYELKDILSINLAKGSREEILELLENDALSLVDYWMVDYNYRDGIFRPQVSIMPVKEKLELEKTVFIESVGIVAVKIVDIFGQKIIKTF